MFSQVQDSFED